MQLSVGSNGRYNYSVAETGSVGKLGIAVQTVNRLYPSLVDGDLYLDASGLDYVHDGDSTIFGNLLTARYEFGDSNSLSGLFLNSTRNTNIVCLRYNGDPPTTLPCGYGPSNTNASNVQLYSLTDNALLGATQLQASIFSMDASNVLDQLDRFVERRAVAERVLERHALDGLLGQRHAAGQGAPHDLDSGLRHVVAVLDHAADPAGGAVLQRLGDHAVQRAAGDRYDPFQRQAHADHVGGREHGDRQQPACRSSRASARRGGRRAHDTYSASFALGGAAATQGRSQDSQRPGVAALRLRRQGGVRQRAGPRAAEQLVELGARRLHAPAARRQRLADALPPGAERRAAAGVRQRRRCSTDSASFPRATSTQVAQVYNSPAGCNTPPGTPF